MTGSMFPGGLRPDGLPAALSDPRRIAAVQETGLLDTEPEQSFDDLAAGITGCDRAFITLVDEDRSFWKSCVGVHIQQTGRQKPARESFCYFLVGLGDRFVVERQVVDPADVAMAGDPLAGARRVAGVEVADRVDAPADSGVVST